MRERRPSRIVGPVPEPERSLVSGWPQGGRDRELRARPSPTGDAATPPTAWRTSAQDWTQSLAINGQSGGCRNQQSLEERILNRLLHLRHRSLNRARRWRFANDSLCPR